MLHTIYWRKEMDKYKMLSLVLLDLCTFAYTMAPEGTREEAFENYEDACRMAEDLELPELQIYLEFMDNTLAEEEREAGHLL